MAPQFAEKLFSHHSLEGARFEPCRKCRKFDTSVAALTCSEKRNCEKVLSGPPEQTVARVGSQSNRSKAHFHRPKSLQQNKLRNSRLC
jgi:hypothetical protein